MTDRIRTITVVLEHEVRIDDAEEGVLRAIRMIKGVASVTPRVTEMADHLNRMILRADLQRTVVTAVNQVFKDLDKDA